MPTPRSLTVRSALVVIALLAAGCDGTPRPSVAGSVGDGAPISGPSAGASDAGDIRSGDTGPGDTGPGGVGSGDTGPGGTGSGDTGPAATRSDAIRSAVPDCDDVSYVAVAPGTPAGEQVAGDVQAWAMEAAPEGFAGLWIDRDAGGVVAVAFAEDLDRWTQEVHARFGPDLRVVGVDASLSELEQLQQLINGWMSAAGNDPRSPGGIQHTSIDVRRNRVGVGVVAPDADDRAAFIEAFGAARLCLEPIAIPTIDDAEVAAWAPVDPDALDPETVRIPIEVMERACAGGEPATGRVAPPEIRYEADAVVVTMRVVPVVGGAECPSNPPTPHVLELAEPLGGRALLDGATDPPQTPRLEP